MVLNVLATLGIGSLIYFFSGLLPELVLGNLLEYSTLFGLVGVNLGAIAFRSIGKNICNLKSFDQQKKHLEEIERVGLINTPDIIQRRKDKVSELVEEENKTFEECDKAKVVEAVSFLISIMLSAFGATIGFSSLSICTLVLSVFVTLSSSLTIFKDEKKLAELDKKISNISNNIQLANYYERSKKKTQKRKPISRDNNSRASGKGVNDDLITDYTLDKIYSNEEIIDKPKILVK